jgi:sulfate adenylyltransferase subunit 1
MLYKGEEIMVLPSQKKSTIKRIFHAGQEVDMARPGESVSIELEEDIDISRGNMIVPASNSFAQSVQLTATLNWMDETPLSAGKTYLLQHGVNIVKAKVLSLEARLDIETMEEIKDAARFQLNDIGRVQIKTARPIFADVYRENPHNGSFILIDEFTNNTSAVGFVEKI